VEHFAFYLLCSDAWSEKDVIVFQRGRKHSAETFMSGNITKNQNSPKKCRKRGATNSKVQNEKKNLKRKKQALTEQRGQT
jgi:hypothetical protein